MKKERRRTMHDFIRTKNEAMLTSYDQQQTHMSLSLTVVFVVYLTFDRGEKQRFVRVVRCSCHYSNNHCCSLRIGHSEYLQTIVVQPTSTVVLAGNSVTLDCTVFNQYGDVAW
jgi:hypothetical protein